MMRAILAGPECTNNPAEDVPEPYDHAQNLTGTLPIELAAKSLILRVYDVLMNDKGIKGLACPLSLHPRRKPWFQFGNPRTKTRGPVPSLVDVL